MYIWDWQLEEWQQQEMAALPQPIARVRIDQNLSKTALMQRFGDELYGDCPTKNPIIGNSTYFGSNWDAFNDCLWCAPEALDSWLLIIHTQLPKLNKREMTIYFDILQNANPTRPLQGPQPLPLLVGAATMQVAQTITPWLIR